MIGFVGDPPKPLNSARYLKNLVLYYYCTTTVLLLCYYCPTTVLLLTIVLLYYCATVLLYSVLHTTVPHQASDLVDCGGVFGLEAKVFNMKGI